MEIKKIPLDDQYCEVILVINTSETFMGFVNTLFDLLNDRVNDVKIVLVGGYHKIKWEDVTFDVNLKNSPECNSLIFTADNDDYSFSFSVGEHRSIKIFLPKRKSYLSEVLLDHIYKSAYTHTILTKLNRPSFCAGKIPSSYFWQYLETKNSDTDDDNICSKCGDRTVIFSSEVEKLLSGNVDEVITHCYNCGKHYIVKIVKNYTLKRME